MAKYGYSDLDLVSFLNLPRNCPLGFEGRECVYIDPNPIGSLNNQGHNYFLSQNGVRIKSKALFGEVYWGIADNLKLTVGARYTNDKKISTQIPSQLWLGGGTESTPQGQATGGRVNRSEEHTSELQSLMRNSYAVFCLKKKTKT